MDLVYYKDLRVGGRTKKAFVINLRPDEVKRKKNMRKTNAVKRIIGWDC